MKSSFEVKPPAQHGKLGISQIPELCSHEQPHNLFPTQAPGFWGQARRVCAPFPGSFTSLHGQNGRSMCINIHVQIKGIEVGRDLDVGLKMLLPPRRAVGMSCLLRNPRVWRTHLPLQVLLPTPHLFRKMDFPWFSLDPFSWVCATP